MDAKLPDISVIRESLKSNTSLALVDEQTIARYGELHREGNDYLFSVYFRTAPKSGLYTPEELQNFMMGLVPVILKPSYVQPFFRRNDGFLGDNTTYLYLGHLNFNEKVGEETTKSTCRLTDKELLITTGFENGERILEQTQPVNRLIVVKPFPNEELARLAISQVGSQDPTRYIEVDSKIRYGDLSKYTNTVGIFGEIRRTVGR